MKMAFADVCFPDKNEKDFIEAARALGTRHLLLAYAKKPDNINEIMEQGKSAGVNVYFASLANEKSGKPWRALLKVCVCPQNAENAIKKFRPDVIAGLEEAAKRDYIHHRGSGLNQVVAATAKKHNAIMCLDFSSILRARGEKQGRIIGRMLQNIRLCEKSGTKVGFASFARKPMELRPAHDMLSFFRAMGASPSTLKKGKEALWERVVMRTEEREGVAIGEGIRVVKDAE